MTTLVSNAVSALPRTADLPSGILLSSLRRQAERRPSQALVIEAESGRALSYAQALAGVAAVRRALGERPRRIMLALPAGLVTTVLWLAALSGGHDLIPTPPEATRDEQARLLRRHQPDLFCVEQADSIERTQLPPQTQIVASSSWERLIAEAPCVDLPEAREGRVHLTTSGSTGEPKGVVLSERQIVWTADQIRRSHALTAADRGLTTLPFFHINAPVVSLCASLLAGATVVVARRFSRQRFWSWIEQYEISWISVVPTIVAFLLEGEPPASIAESLRFARSASAPLPPANLRAFEERFGIPLIETYGLSEAASQVAANPLPPAVHKPGSVGRPTGVALRICRPRSSAEDSVLRDVPPGEVGEICIAGPNVIAAYQDGAGSEAFEEGWFRTGDLGYLDEDGYLFIKGRLREVINRGGENIVPREIEETLLEHEGVREAAVVGRPHPLYGEVVVAYVSPRAGYQLSAEELHACARQHLSPPRRPVDFIILAELPRNAAGKIDRRLLRTREQARATTISREGQIQR